ncbi:MAG: hypothetical protein RJB13_1096 [Pseudomonadota bacterium]|jgi:hypothetical protein
MKMTTITKTIGLSIIAIGFFTACGQASEQSAQSQSLQDDLEMARKVVVKCNNVPSAEELLALELSKTCREQNIQLKAKGVSGCAEDYCTDMVSLESQRRGLEFDLGYDGEVEFLVTISSDFLESRQEKMGLICYSPVLKARELLGSLGDSCK